MACTWASKVNGILTVVAIGIAVLIDLWDILDIRKGHTMVNNMCLCLCSIELIICAGLFYKTFHGESHGLDRPTDNPIPFLLLGSPHSAYKLGSWRHIHEPSIPRDA